MVFIGEGLNLSGNRALDGSLIHVKDPSIIRVDNVTNHTFTTKLYPQRSDCNIQIDLLSNQPISLFFF
uniref:ORF67d n=1 Tax=Pinus koraiensis TaxID=88728 RepID=A4QM19_PINKO|nr:ORF67d [Pinus koraiensis]ABP35345.1 ORF67d [Pinus koraiensis]